MQDFLLQSRLNIFRFITYFIFRYVSSYHVRSFFLSRGFIAGLVNLDASPHYIIKFSIFIPSSFLGFAMDDFNAVDRIRRLHVINNMYSMASSNLSASLYNKRKDLQFYPVMYLETGGFETLKRNYDKFISGIILTSTSPISYSPHYNLTLQNDSMKALSKMFENKPLKYVLYPKSQNATLSDNFLANTLYTASRLFNELIIYVRSNSATRCQRCWQRIIGCKR